MTKAKKLATSQIEEVHVDRVKCDLRAQEHQIAICDNFAPAELLTYAAEKGFLNICQRQGFEFEKELLSSRLLIENSKSFFEFPLSSILCPQNVGKNSEATLVLSDQSFNSSSQKLEILKHFVQVMESQGLNQSIIEDAISVCDELFTNAIFNAPFIDPSNQFNPGVSRTEMEIIYESGKFSRIFIGKDETRLVIGCRDPFGSLDLSSYLKKIKTTYDKGPAAVINFGPGGAGIGSYIIFDLGASFYFGVLPGRLTQLCCVMPLGIGYRKRSLLPKHLHWIQR